MNRDRLKDLCENNLLGERLAEARISHALLIIAEVLRDGLEEINETLGKLIKIGSAGAFRGG